MDFEKVILFLVRKINSKATDCKLNDDAWLYMNHGELFLGLSGLKCIFSHFVINGIIPTTIH